MQINIEERAEKARKLFAEGYNCSQAVVLAYADCFGVDRDLAATLAAPLGGGVGRMREVCGAVTGMALVAGLRYPANNPADKEAKMRNYAVVKEVGTRFSDKFGSVVCRELLGLTPEKESGVSTNASSANPVKRCSCAEIVETAARIVGERIAL